MTEVRRLAHEGLEAASRQTEPGEKNQDEPQRPCPTPLRSEQGHLDLSRSILTSSQTHRIFIEGRPTGHPGRSLERPKHLPGSGLRSSGMPHASYVDSITNDGPGFHLNRPVSELTKRVTRAIEASDVSSAPPVAKTKDGVTHET